MSRTKQIVEVSSGYTYFRDRDVLVAKITPCFENGKAAQVSNLTGGIGFGSTEFHVLRARSGLDGRFLLHLVRSAPFRDAGTASMYGAGGQKRVPTDFVADFVVPLPSPTEQQAIADFLDRETAKIDGLIAKQTEFLTLLDEHRQALITEGVTRGLDPSVPMRETGIETFRSIPAHWRVKRLKQVIRPGTSISYGIVQPGDHDPDGTPFVQTADLTQRRFDPALLPRTAPHIARAYPRSRLGAGDVLLGIRASVGDSVLVPPELDGANLSRGIARIVPGSEIKGQFLMLVLGLPQSKLFWAMHMQGSTFREVSIETVRELPIVVPPITEQAAVICHLDDRLARLDATHACSTEMVTRLRERRAALITAAVTGQIDVTQPVLTQAAD